ncbi:MAG: NAD(P)H-hydrate dehydratase, partial [Clostridia bacterium]|nr:NAD(P)H-hydrate dehydratase [Clostridia bacterium]
CAGSEGMAGAAVTAALACLRAGSGLVTALCPREVIPILQKTVPAAMCRALEDGTEVKHDVLLLGPGLAETEETWALLSRLHGGGPEVWDAGALNLLSRHPMPLGENAVITPHAGEAARLLGWEVSRVTDDLPAAALALQERYGCCVVLKSHVSVLAGPEGRVAVNAVPAPALAKGGSGDALAGILASLLGQGLPIFEAMQAACLWHSLAGRLAGERIGVRSALPQDVIECLGDTACGPTPHPSGFA